MSTNRDRASAAGVILATLLSSAPAIGADPCGMVPPVYNGDGPALTRVGVQRTFVFHKDGVQSIVIQPAFEGRVHEFGMLVPFPNPPEIKKVADDVFEQIQAAIDPPEVQVGSLWGSGRLLEVDAKVRSLSALGYRSRNEVVVLREEAVGMYELAVLEAGSAAALSRWMEEHGYRYPEGMDAVCEDYVDDGWCFVAVKTRVGAMPGVEARPGMRDVEPVLPPGASFDGAVQAMSFRFRSEEIVVPMRLSAFNGGELHNAVYVLADQPLRIRDIPRLLVARQVRGEDLFHNLLRPLPVRIHSGETWEQLDDPTKSWAELQRDPYRKNGGARDLFAADLLAADGGGLLSPLEAREKQLLNLGEALGLRGDVYDDLVTESMRSALDEAAAESLGALEGMTLTVIDGLFPRSVLAAANLTFEEYEMPAERNQPDRYDAKLGGPAPVSSGSVHRGATPLTPLLGGGRAIPREGGPLAVLAAGLGLLLAASLVAVRRRKGSLCSRRSCIRILVV